ncbi:hypothetical protein PFLUV_G00259820 [Perca fluviatilis]|uniref:Kinetochore protein NDC80 loop region domain-containing protein n=1 Tax=Perca fluviatilis TaxID=8168 RepID=A0A6A5DVY6_PERFL|nr:hypothetical protein PFLUV_G00259820 [Perca fluviatilis]
MLLRKLISYVELENNQLANIKLSLEESCEQVLAKEEQEWVAEKKSVENHRKLLEKKVNFGYDESVQQQYHLVLQETNQERQPCVCTSHSY